MKNVRSYIFIDEFEDVPATAERAGQWIFFSGVGIPQLLLEPVNTKLNILLDPLEPHGFHAKDCYKEKSPNLELMNAMTDIVFSLRLPWFCFPFSKSWLSSPRLAVLQKLDLEGLPPNVNISNYKFVALYLFVHCLNTLLQRQSQLENASRLVCDQGILERGDAFPFDDSETLSTIEKVTFASRKQNHRLSLPDHLSFLFGKCRRELIQDNGEINLEPTENNTVVQNECAKHITKLSNAHLFHLLDLPSWIDHENKRLDELKRDVGSSA